MPSSGLAETRLINSYDITERLWSTMKSIITLLTPWFFTNDFSGKRRLFAATASLLIFVLLWFFRKEKLPKSVLNLKLGKSHYILNWFLSLTTLLFIYPVFFWSTHFYTRYFCPLFIVIIPIMTMLFIERFSGESSIFKKTALLFLPLCFFFWVFFYFHLGKTENLFAVTTGFIKNNFPPPIKVAAFQSGTIGFFNENVVNLDGKMNSSIHNCKTPEELNSYIDKEKIDAVVDWGPIIYYSFIYRREERFNNSWRYFLEKLPDGKSACIVRRGLSLPIVDNQR